MFLFVFFLCCLDFFTVCCFIVCFFICCFCLLFYCLLFFFFTLPTVCNGVFGVLVSCCLCFVFVLFVLFILFILCFCACVFCLSPSDVCIIASPTGTQKIFLCSIVFCFCPVFERVSQCPCPFRQTAVQPSGQPGNQQAPDIAPGTAKSGAQIVKKQEIKEFQAVQHCS